MKSYAIAGCLISLSLLAGLNLLITWAVQSLWNWLMPLFWEGAPILTFWQTFGCMFLITFVAGLVGQAANSK